MKPEFQRKKYRTSFLSAFIRQGIALQIQLLRKREQWSQKRLGEEARKTQSAITRLEDPSYGKFTLTTLLEIASAFDVALSVRFVPFSELEKQSRTLTPDVLTVARFKDEMPHELRPIPPAFAILTTASNSSGLSVLPATLARLDLRDASRSKKFSTIQATGQQ